MPVLSYDKADLLSLIGKRLSDGELGNLLSSLKPELEEIDEKEVKVEHCPDRPDLFPIEGLARAIRFRLGMESYKEFVVDRPRLQVVVKDVRSRPFIACAVIRGVRIDDRYLRSLMQVQEAFHETLGKGREKVAIGIHDLDKIEPPIEYRRGRRDETFVPLGEREELTLVDVLEKTEKGRTYAHLVREELPVYVDSLGIFSFPPILNSERTRVTTRTKNLFVELTGTHFKLVNQVLVLLATSLVERGGKLEGVEVVTKKGRLVTPVLEKREMKLSVPKCNSLLGLSLSAREVASLLGRMGYGVREVGKDFVVLNVPPYRTDILHEVDLIEDVAIAYGYENFVPELPNLATIGGELEIERFSSSLRELVIGLGYQEVMLPILSSREKQEKFAAIEELVTLANPVSKLYDCLRVSLLPGLLGFLALNKHLELPQRIFELGDVVVVDEKEETRTRSVRKLALATCDSDVGYEAIASDVDAILSSLEMRYRLLPCENANFIRGRCAEIRVKNESIGVMGEVNPSLLEDYEIWVPVVMAELDVTKLCEITRT